VMRSEANYQTWWNGGARTSPYFHNMIGLLTEMKGEPTPIDIPFLPELQLPHNDYPMPIAPQKWHFRSSIEYAITADRAVLDMASKHREEFLFNIYRMGINSIYRGSQDNWTINPKKVAAVRDAIERDGAKMVGSARSRGYPPEYFKMFRIPEERDPRGYILPADQPDFPTAVKFVNTLIKNGIFVERATRDFKIGGRKYPAGSFVVRTAQAFRPHIIDMFEPQVYPDDIPCTGCPPRPPYDATGYTLAFQMGVGFDRILEGFDGPFERLPDVAPAPEGRVESPESAGFLLSAQVNDSFLAVNRLLAHGSRVFRLSRGLQAGGASFPPGTFYIGRGETTVASLETLAREKGLVFQGIAAPPAESLVELKPVRIGLWDRYGGSMPSGWVRWLFEQYEFPFQVVFPQELDAGRLGEKFDVLVFVEDAIPAVGADEAELTRSQPAAGSIPAEWRNRLGAVTAGRTVPVLRQFLEDGGTILAVGSSTHLGYHLRLPMASALIDPGTGKPLAAEKYYIPGSVLQVRVDPSHPLAYGLPEVLDVYFDESPAFRIQGPAVRRVAWFDTDRPLRSGWAWGQQALAGTTAVAEAQVGRGRLLMFGPLITFRGQPHGTFKFLFNGIYFPRADR